MNLTEQLNPLDNAGAGDLVGEEIPTPTKLIGAGFPLLSTVFSYLQIRDRDLTDLFGENPQTAMWTGLMLAIGIALGSLTTLPATTVRMKTLHLVLGLIGLVVATQAVTAFHWDRSSFNVIVFLVVVFVLALALVIPARLNAALVPLPAGLLVTALVCSCMGLYSGAAMALTSLARAESPEASISISGSLRKATVSITTSSKNDEHGLAVLVTGLPMTAGADRRGEQQLALIRVSPDRNGDISDERNFHLDLRPWARVELRQCRFIEHGCDSTNASGWQSTHVLPIRGLYGASRTSGAVSVSKSKKVASARIQGVAMQDGASVCVFLDREIDGKLRTSFSRVTPAPSGDLRWRSRVPILEGTSRVALWALTTQDDCGLSHKPQAELIASIDLP